MNGCNHLDCCPDCYKKISLLKSQNNTFEEKLLTIHKLINKFENTSMTVDSFLYIYKEEISDLND